MIAALMALLAASQEQAPPTPPGPPIVVNAAPGCGPPFARVYIAPLGLPFRTDGFTDPAAAWFAQADADHDGRVTLKELAADADRTFALLDTNHDGEIDPQELSTYENVTAPEIKLYQRGQYKQGGTRQQKKDRREAARRRADYEAPYGAGLWASLNIPEPVVSADLDLNRGISKAEMEAAASSRFPLLAGEGQDAIRFATLARSPAQLAVDACRAQDGKTKKGRE